MAENRSKANGGDAWQREVSLSAVVSLLLGTLAISTAYGIILLLPLYVRELGGDEAIFGVILSSAFVTAVLCIGLLIRYPEVMRPHAVVALAIAVYALGAAGAAFVGENWMPLIATGALLGTAWAVIYTATPMVMSEMVTDERRATYFGYITGTQQVGIGMGPVLARFLVETPLGFRGTFLAAGALALVAVALTVAVGLLTPDTRGQRSSEQASATDNGEEARAPFGKAIGQILRSEAAFSLVMILLFACLFTSLTQFQTTFAAARQLNYSVFYATYTAAVIASRFGLTRFASRLDTKLVIAVSVSAMALSVSAFFIVGSNTLLYGMASAFVGLGYGLALPSVQAQAVNVSEPAVRPRVLPLAGLVFQAAMLGFPLIAGWIIADLGYQALFVVLVTFAFIQAAIGWWRFSAARSSAGVVSVSAAGPSTRVPSGTAARNGVLREC